MVVASERSVCCNRSSIISPSATPSMIWSQMVFLGTSPQSKLHVFASYVVTLDSHQMTYQAVESAYKNFTFDSLISITINIAFLCSIIGLTFYCLLKILGSGGLTGEAEGQCLHLFLIQMFRKSESSRPFMQRNLCLDPLEDQTLVSHLVERWKKTLLLPVWQEREKY